jgi:RecA/RadA recombinase
MATKEEKQAKAEAASDIAAIFRKAANAAAASTKLEHVYEERECIAHQCIPTGNLCIDWKLGGGIPPGRIIGIPGPEGSGKSLLAADIAHEALKAGIIVVYFDAEGAIHPGFLMARGINFEKYRGARKKDGSLKDGEYDQLHFFQPENSDQFKKYICTFLDALPTPDDQNGRPPVLFLLDSAVALLPTALDDNMDGNNMAAHAKMYAEILMQIQPRLSRTRASLIYTNQIRLKPMVQYGSPEYEPCGEALKFYSSVRTQLDRSKPKLIDRDHEHPFVVQEASGFIPDAKPRAGGIWEESCIRDGVVVGMDKYKFTSLNTIKNKVHTPFQVTWFRVQTESAGATGYGMDPVFDVFTFLAETGLIKKAEKREGEKVDQVRRLWEPVKNEHFDLATIGIVDRFDYYTFKYHVLSRPDIKTILREHFITTGLVYKIGAK